MSTILKNVEMRQDYQNVHTSKKRAIKDLAKTLANDNSRKRTEADVFMDYLTESLDKIDLSLKSLKLF